MPDDVPDAVKSARLTEIIALQGRTLAGEQPPRRGDANSKCSPSRCRTSATTSSRSRTSQNKVVVFDRRDWRPGDYVRVRITGCTPVTLIGEPIDNR